MSEADIGVIGLAVMGENLVLNMANHGFTVAVYNRTTQRVDDLIEGRAKDKTIIGTHNPEELVNQLKRPRRVMLMVQAGAAVDKVISDLLPYLESGDIVIDGGNSNYGDTIRRTHEMTAKGLLYVGTGVSGGEEGALIGPSIMPGGNREAWPHVKNIFQSIAAKVDDGAPCCDWVGSDGAGHYVKMVHNGIEYGDMQMIAEAYALMKHALGMEAGQMGEVFSEWNTGELDSYLIEITAEILAKVDEETGRPMVDVILDAAGQKGRDGDLVGGVQRASRVGALADAAEAELERREPRGVRLLERQLAEEHGVEPDQVRRRAVGVVQREVDRPAHVRRTHLRDHRAVAELDHRVDDRLAVDQHRDALGREPEQVGGLEDLERRVHQRRRADRDARAHVPVRVDERARGGDVGELLDRQVAEGAAAGREVDAAHAVRVLAAQALEDRRVLRVGRRHRHAVLLEQRQDRGPARDERLLVRERDVLARLDRLDSRQQPRAADDARDDDVRVRAIQDVTEILMLPVKCIDVGALLGQCVFELVLGAVHVGLIGITDADDPNARLGGEVTQMTCPLAAAADDGDADIRVGAQHAVGGKGHGGPCKQGAFHKTPAVDFIVSHDLIVLCLISKIMRQESNTSCLYSENNPFVPFRSVPKPSVRPSREMKLGVSGWNR